MEARIIANSIRSSRTGRASGHEPDKKARASRHPYRLQVVTQIDRAQLNTLYTLGPQLRDVIEGVGLPLFHSCWDISNDVVKTVHYWGFEDEDHPGEALIEAGLKLPDKPAYARFERLIIEEQKDLVIQMASGRPVDESLLMSGRYVYVQVIYEVQTKDLAEFQARLEGTIMQFAVLNDWMLGEAYIGVTGRAGEIVQLWLVPEEAAVLADRRLASTSWQQLLKEVPRCLVLEPTPIDPILGENNDESLWQRKSIAKCHYSYRLRTELKSV